MSEPAINLSDQYTADALAGKGVQELCDDWLLAKRAVDLDQAHLDAVSAALAAKLEHKSEGSKSHKAGDFTVTIDSRINRRLDAAKWDEVKAEIPEDYWPVEMKPEVSATRVKWLKENEPELWRKMAAAITEKPGKLGVKVVRKEAAYGD